MCVFTSTGTVWVTAVEENKITILQLFRHVQAARVYVRTHIIQKMKKVKK